VFYSLTKQASWVGIICQKNNEAKIDAEIKDPEERYPAGLCIWSQHAFMKEVLRRLSKH